MKKLLAILSVLIICISFCVSNGEIATPTDLMPQERQVLLEFLKVPKRSGEEGILKITLINFLPTDIYIIEWQYSLDCTTWITIENAYDETYSFILDEINCNYWWRVIVHYHETGE